MSFMIEWKVMVKWRSSDGRLRMIWNTIIFFYLHYFNLAANLVEGINFFVLKGLNLLCEPSFAHRELIYLIQVLRKDNRSTSCFWVKTFPTMFGESTKDLSKIFMLIRQTITLIRWQFVVTNELSCSISKRL